MDEILIQTTETYAQERGRSLSPIVADHQRAADKLEASFNVEDLPPITRSLIGSVQIENVVEDDYYAYLVKKYQ